MKNVPLLALSYQKLPTNRDPLAESIRDIGAWGHPNARRPTERKKMRRPRDESELPEIPSLLLRSFGERLSYV
jgi:hypothetical protein